MASLPPPLLAAAVQLYEVICLPVARIRPSMAACACVRPDRRLRWPGNDSDAHTCSLSLSRNKIEQLCNFTVLFSNNLEN